MKSTPIRNNFNAGELSPKIDFRGDVDKYHSGCITLENMVPMVEGGAFRMPGTKFIAHTKTQNEISRIVPFRANSLNSYWLEFGKNYIRFYKDGERIEVTGVPVEVTTTYAEADINSLNFGAASADILYIFHGSYATRKLARLSDTEWEFGEVNFRPPPTRELGHVLDAILTPGATTGTGITFTTSVGVFLAGDEGRLIQSGLGRATITAYVAADNVTCDILDDFPSVDPIASGDWNLLGSPTGEVNPDKHVSGDICTLTGAIDLFRTEDLGKYVYINGGSIRLTIFTSAKVVAGEIMQDLGGGNPTNFFTLEETMWSAARGYPKAGGFFEQRLVTGGSPSFPQTYHLSVSSDYENFTRDANLDDAAIEFTLVSREPEEINWFSGRDSLMIGTISGLWKSGSSSLNDPITQTNITAKKQIGFGTYPFEPANTGDSLIWADSSGIKVNRLDFKYEVDKFVSTNMSRLASHITLGTNRATSGVKEVAFQQSPVPIVWAIRNDGQLLGMTYETQEDVYAWFRVVTDGYFESVAVGQLEGEEDQIWCVVRRTINGSTVRNIEQFQPMELFGQIADSFFVHSGVSFDGGAAATITNISKANPAVVSCVNTFTNGDKVWIRTVEGMTEVNTPGVTTAYTVANRAAGSFELSGIDSTGWTTYTGGGTAQVVKKSFTTGLDHLEGEAVDIVVDGAAHSQETVTGGAVTLDYYGNKINLGLPCPPVLEPTKPYINTPQGISRGKKQRASSILLSFYESYGCKIGKDSATLMQVPFPVPTSPTLYTTEIIQPFPGDWDKEAPLYITQDLPLPLTIRALVYDFNYNED